MRLLPHLPKHTTRPGPVGGPSPAALEDPVAAVDHDLGHTPSAEDDPGYWAAVAASLDDQGGVGPSPAQPLPLKRHLSELDPSLSQQLRLRRVQVRDDFVKEGGLPCIMLVWPCYHLAKCTGAPIICG